MVTFISPLTLAILTPIIGTLLMLITSRFANIRDTIMVLSSLILLTVICCLVQHYFEGYTPFSIWFTLAPSLHFSFGLEPLGLLFALMVCVLWLITIVYAIGYMRANMIGKQTQFYCFISLTIASTIALALSDNLLTLFICYELITWCTYPLITFGGKDKDIKAGRLYLGLLLIPSILFLLPATLLIWFKVGHLNFVAGGILPESMNPAMIAVLVLLVGYGTSKLALMPLHRWLPAAMVAPVPVSGLLHAVAVVNAGAFTLIKVIIYIFGYERLAALADITPSLNILSIVAMVTILTSSVIALRKDDLKQLLAYSTISHLGYIALAASLFTPKALLAAILHLVAHGFAKITLFFTAGNMATTHHKTKVSELTGIGLQMPLTMAGFTIAVFSLIGMPLTLGFYSKWFLFQGAFERPNIAVILVIIASTLLNIAYFFPIIYRAFFKKPLNQAFTPGIKEAPYPMALAVTLTSLGLIALFLMPELVIHLAHDALHIGE